MNSRFNTVDIRVAVHELRNGCLGLRVANVYDIDNKTYIIKLAKPDEKIMIVLESGNKIHLSQFDWPKNTFPSGFSMKLRKHLRTRRLESVEQLGVDRIVDLQFGSNGAAYHIILELYDRGNIILTDCDHNILNILRPRTDDSQEVRFAVNEKYPLELARQQDPLMSEDRLRAILDTAQEGDNIKRLLLRHVCYGPPLIEHCLIGAGLTANVAVGKGFSVEDDLPKLMCALTEAEDVFGKLGQPCKGYIIQKKLSKAKIVGGALEELLTYDEFNPLLFRQHEHLPYVEFDTFNNAVDEFFSKRESQKIDIQAIQQEKSALKKLDNVRKDHEKRVSQLQNEQEEDKRKAQLIEINLTLVERAIGVVRTALANQIDWTEIQNLVKEAQLQGDPVAGAIKGLKLNINHITMLLGFPYVSFDSDEEEDEELKPMKVDIDLALSAYANARKYFDLKKSAAVKEQKTVDASSKALKSAERKTKETLKEVATKVTIQKLRKVHWFEKFLWFVTSENFLVIAGRDQQQNEIIYKRYLKPGDIYVHADLHGASSVIVKNHTKDPIPPKTLNEAGTMAICNSAAWDAKVVTSAWWVYHNQVSKTAPTGEYLTTGSFMIRGKKNYLPPSHLVYGFGVLFKVDEGSVFRHKGERQVRIAEEDKMSESTSESDAQDSVELDISDSDSDETDTVSSDASLSPIQDGESASRTGECSGMKDNVSAPLPSVGELTIKDCDVAEESAIDVNSDCMNTHETCAVNEVLSMNRHEDRSVKETEDEADENEAAFPDTSISLAHVAGDKFELQRIISTSSSHNDPFENEVKTEVKVPQRLTAKQRRELKKKKKGEQDLTGGLDEETSAVCDDELRLTPSDQLVNGYEDDQSQQQQQQQQQQPKRGQRAKMKKMKKKYGDQDDDERQLRMEILASAGKQNEDIKKKGKKGKQQQQQQKQQQQQQRQQQQRVQQLKGGKLSQKQMLQEQDVVNSSVGVIIQGDNRVPASSVIDDGNVSDEEKQAVLEDENITLVDDSDVLDTFTGLPLPDDELLYAIPYCAPYSMLLNFKYKVKLTPGSTKRGKAAKTALHMFTVDRMATSRERDLLKSIKDSDLSRNLPGKVKVSAPNLQKSKGKK